MWQDSLSSWYWNHLLSYVKFRRIVLVIRECHSYKHARAHSFTHAHTQARKRSLSLALFLFCPCFLASCLCLGNVKVISHSNALQRTTTQCNTLQHNATHCSLSFACRNVIPVKGNKNEVHSHVKPLCMWHDSFSSRYLDDSLTLSSRHVTIWLARSLQSQVSFAE